MWQKSYNKGGIFRFSFYVKDRWVAINVDDRLPARLYSHRNGGMYRTWNTHMSRNGAWWMPLLEKAYAKLNQNFIHLHSGGGDEGMRALTGMPSTWFWHNRTPKEKILAMHKYGTKMDYPMVGSVKAGKSWQGLVSYHAYTLLGIHELTDESGKMVHRLA